MDMNKKDLKRLRKSQLIKLLLKQEAKRPSNSVNEPIPPPKTGKLESIKPTRKPQPPTPKDDFNFDDDIFQTENQSLEKFEIISVQSRENKKFKSYRNDFEVKILKELDDVKEIYRIFQELVKTVKRRRKLSDNDMLRLVILNEELPNVISTKFNRVQDFKLGDLENVINILEYRAIPIEECKIVVQSVKIPAGKGRLYLRKITFRGRTVSLRLRTTIAYVWLEL